MVSSWAFSREETNDYCSFHARNGQLNVKSSVFHQECIEYSTAAYCIIFMVLWSTGNGFYYLESILRMLFPFQLLQIDY